ncbi:MAG: prepilin-type N-terminal cleavage/methylation domain-containing protein [Candidatus Omnitrophota bacterium]
MKKGFTLIELLIVIMVIAVLIGIALPRFRGMQDEASTTKAAAELRTLQTAVESYYIHSNPHAYPAAGATWEASLTTAKPQIISVALTDPFASTTQYQFAVSSNNQYYVIWSIGSDRASGVTGVSDTGIVSGTPGDDIYVSNGTSGTGGF